MSVTRPLTRTSRRLAAATLAASALAASTLTTAPVHAASTDLTVTRVGTNGFTWSRTDASLEGTVSANVGAVDTICDNVTPTTWTGYVRPDASLRWITAAQRCVGDGAHTVKIVAYSTPQALYEGLYLGNPAYQPLDVETVSITIDSVAPAAPVVTSPANNSTTYNRQPTISGTGEPNATVRGEIGGQLFSATVAANGTWSTTLATPLPGNDGPNFYVHLRAYQVDRAGNGSPDAPVAKVFVRHPDADGDGLSDITETAIGTDKTKVDTDGDGLSDGDEIFIHHTNPLQKDTDGDGIMDGQEVSGARGFVTSALLVDTDGDSWADVDELDAAGTDPTDASSHPVAAAPSTTFVTRARLVRGITVAAEPVAGFDTDREIVAVRGVASRFARVRPVAGGYRVRLLASAPKKLRRGVPVQVVSRASGVGSTGLTFTTPTQVQRIYLRR